MQRGNRMNGPATVALPPQQQHQQAMNPAQMQAQRKQMEFASQFAGHDTTQFKVPVRPQTTHLTPLGKDDPELPPISPADAQQVKQWIQRDMAHDQAHSKEIHVGRQKVIALAQAHAKEDVQDWIGPFTEAPTQQQQSQQQRLLFTQDHIRARAQGKRGKMRAALGWDGQAASSNPAYTSHRGGRGAHHQQLQQQQQQQQQQQHTTWQEKRKQLELLSEEAEVLVPVRIDAEHEGVKLRDVFTWNIRDTSASPRIFVQHLLADLQIPPSLLNHFYTEVHRQIEDQLNEVPGAAFESSIHSTFRADHLKQVDEDDSWLVFEPAQLSTEDISVSPSEGSSSSSKSHEELRIHIKIDVTLDSLNLTDTVEWDISDPYNDPEAFAQTLCNDLGLPGEFITAVAHSIREQVEAHVKSLSLVGHTLGAPIANDELKSSFLPPLSAPAAVRPLGLITDYTPELNVLSVDDLERQLAQRDRESRRKRRQTRGRQRVNLPDREPLKTFRTLVPRPGGKPPTMVQQQTPTNNDDDDDEDAYIDPEEREMGNRPRLGDFDIARPYKIRRITPSSPKFKSSVDEAAAQMDHEPPKKKGNRGRPRANAHLYNNNLAAGLSAASPGGPSTLGGNAVTEADFARVNQHMCWIDGKWHCANCGGPEDVVPGRRKGPAGEKTVCAACGKHWMRFKKNRPCEYTTSGERHLEMMRAEEEGDKTASNESKSRSGRGAGSSGNSSRPTPTAAAKTVAPPTSLGSEAKGGNRSPTPLSDLSDVEGDVPMPSTSSASSVKPMAAAPAPSPQPAAVPHQQLAPHPAKPPVKPSLSAPAPPPPPAAASMPPPPQPTPPAPSAALPPVSAVPPPQAAPASQPPQTSLPHQSPPAPAAAVPSQSPPDPAPLPASSAPSSVPSTAAKAVPAPPPVPVRTPSGELATKAAPPAWLTSSASALRASKPDDRFEIIQRPSKTNAGQVEWRIRCYDCPGKIYTPGPGETLENFNIHVANRHHRANVTARLEKEKEEKK